MTTFRLQSCTTFTIYSTDQHLTANVPSPPKSWMGRSRLPCCRPRPGTMTVPRRRPIIAGRPSPPSCVKEKDRRRARISGNFQRSGIGTSQLRMGTVSRRIWSELWRTQRMATLTNEWYRPSRGGTAEGDRIGSLISRHAGDHVLVFHFPFLHIVSWTTRVRMRMCQRSYATKRDLAGNKPPNIIQSIAVCGSWRRAITRSSLFSP